MMVPMMVSGDGSTSMAAAGGATMQAPAAMPMMNPYMMMPQPFMTPQQQPHQQSPMMPPTMPTAYPGTGYPTMTPQPPAVPTHPAQQQPHASRSNSNNNSAHSKDGEKTERLTPAS